MDKILLIIPLFFVAFMANAQNKKSEPIQKKADIELNKNEIKPKHAQISEMRAPQFTTSSATQQKPRSILQELYSIEDERNRIEGDKTLSTLERNQKMEANSSIYQEKINEFKRYVNSTGVINISNKEQGYYLSILKNDNQIELYKKTIELIKKSK